MTVTTARPGSGREMFRDMTIIDADTHLTEPHDLWTRHAPKGFEDRVPQVRLVDGQASWVIDGSINLGRAMASGVVGLDGKKLPGTTAYTLPFEEIHRGAHDIEARLAMMDEQGIDAQILYPNTIGFGGQRFFVVKDPELRLLTLRVYNDAMAEIQESSGGRLLPMGVIPWWDLEASVAELTRFAGLGLHGLNTTAHPHEYGLPDLADPYWNPIWEAAADLELPVNFHIGASDSAMDWFGSVPWPSHGADQKMGIGSAMIYLHNASVVANMVYSGVLERFPTLQMVSVESGVGWIPFLMRALDYQIGEMAPGAMDFLSMAPSEYIRRQVHSCFWFEKEGLNEAIAAIGPQHLMFETDFPHPTCLYPDGLDTAAEALAPVDPALRADLMGGNAARLYRIDLPEG